MTLEQIIAELPRSVRDAIESDDSTAFQRAFDALSPQEQQQVQMALWVQQAGSEDEEDSSDMADVLANFEPLLQAIAVVAAGDTAQKGEIETELADLETKGWRLSEPVKRIWAGERDVTALTAGLDAQDTALVKRLLPL